MRKELIQLEIKCETGDIHYNERSDENETVQNHNNINLYHIVYQRYFWIS